MNCLTAMRWRQAPSVLKTFFGNQSVLETINKARQGLKKLLISIQECSILGGKSLIKFAVGRVTLSSVLASQDRRDVASLNAFVIRCCRSQTYIILTCTSCPKLSPIFSSCFISIPAFILTLLNLYQGIGVVEL